MAGARVATGGARRSIAIDVRMADGHSGIGTYIRNVVPRIVSRRPDWQFTVLADRDAPADWLAASNVDVVRCACGIYSLAEQVELPLKARGARVLWSPHYNIPVAARATLVVTVHDVCHLARPDLYAGALRQAYARRMLAAVRRRATEIMFVSEFSRLEFERHVGAPRCFTTVLNGVDAAWFSRPERGVSPHPRPYVLFIGSAKPQKNLTTLARALESMTAADRPDLVIIGSLENHRTVDRAAIAAVATLGHRATIVGNADDSAVRRFLSHADALVMPSLYEGFGLPALEAMASGCPVVVAHAGSLPEVCGSAALYCDPSDAADIARQIDLIRSNAKTREGLIAAGRRRAAALTWDDTAARATEVLQRAMAGAER